MQVRGMCVLVCCDEIFGEHCFVPVENKISKKVFLGGHCIEHLNVTDQFLVFES